MVGKEDNNNAEKTALDQWLSRTKKDTTLKGVGKMPDDQPNVLSSGQERLLLLEQLYPNQALYNYTQHYKISGALDVDKLVESFQILAKRHEILRSNYQIENDVYVQFIKHDDMPIDLIVVSGSTASEKQQKVNDQITNLAHVAFNLSRDSLFRLYIFDLGENKFELLLVLHHIVGDGWSMNIINEQISSIYNRVGNENKPALIDLKLQYTDFAYWQKKQKIKDSDLSYWKEKLAGELPILNLPKTNIKSRNSFKGKTYRKNLSKDLSQQLKKIAQEKNTTMYSLLLAAYKILLSKYCNETDIIVGSPFSNRDLEELEQIVGFFNETVVLRTHINNNSSFSQTIDQIKETTLDAFAHKNVPFETLVNELKPERQAGENPIFQSMFLYNGLPTSLNLGGGIEIEENMLDLGVSKFDLTLFVNEKKDSLELLFEHSIGFDDDFINSMANHFDFLLTNLIQHPEEPISNISLLSNEELKTITQSWNNNKIDLPAVKSIHELIIDQANLTPDAIAVVCDNKSLSYKELDQWSNQIAATIKKNGIANNEFIGLFTKRSLEMVVGILGILKAGAAYLPLDPDYPKDRISFMLSDTNAKIVLLQPGLANPFEQEEYQFIEIEKLQINKNDVNRVEFHDHLDDYAYVIYTSGSTGKPKGVAITHQNLIHSTTARFDFYEDNMDCFLLLSSFSFDSSIVGIFWSLSSGGKLVLPPKRIEQDIAQLSTIISEHHVTHTLMLPSLYQVLLSFSSPEKLKSLKAVIVAGETCSVNLRNDHFKLLPCTRFYNEYGPTEATVWCIAHEITSGNTETLVPIGKPTQNASAYILDGTMSPVPIGISGELYIGGIGIANGYLNRPDLTTDRFLSNPFTNNEGKIYKTGDLAKFNIDGVIEFLGRTDTQIKIRGHRVELEEIKTIILENNKVDDAVVNLIKEGTIEKLIAWVQTDDITIVSAILQNLKTVLPNYMVPSLIEVVSTFPRLPNGKIDTKNLPYSFTKKEEDLAYIPPSNDVEKLLIEIWEEVLKINPIGIEDVFFDIGGDSILSIQIVSKAQQRNLSIQPTDLFNYQTIEKLAEKIRVTENEGFISTENWSSIVPMKTSGEKSPLFCLHSGGAHVMFYQGLAKYISSDRPVYAIQPTGLDGNQEYHDSVAKMASHYILEMQKVQAKGPYHLVSTCFGNAVGIEMTHQLHEKGEQVAVLYVVDSAPVYIKPPSPNGERKPIRRMLQMFAKGEFHAISKKFENKFIRFNKKRTADQRDQQEAELDEIIGSLNDLYTSYTWRPIEGKIVFIRSSEFSRLKRKEFHLKRWKYLAKNNLETYETDGHHLTLFKEPEVQGLTNIISSHLSKMEV